MKFAPWLVIFLGVVIGAIRVWMAVSLEPSPAHLEDTYKDIAHMFIGGLFVHACYSWKSWPWILFWGLCVLELMAAFIPRIFS